MRRLKRSGRRIKLQVMNDERENSFFIHVLEIILPQQSNQFFEEEEEEDKEEMIWFGGVFYVVRLSVFPPLLFASLCTARV